MVEIPNDIAITLKRALVWCGTEITSDQREEAWAWIEEHNYMEEMGG